MLPSLRRHEDERATMLHALGRCYALGHPIDWGGLMPGPHRFVRLPLYSWQRERFWYESEESRVDAAHAPGPSAARGRTRRTPAHVGGAARPPPGAVPRRSPRPARGDPARDGLPGAGLRGGSRGLRRPRLRGPRRHAGQSLLPGARPAPAIADRLRPGARHGPGPYAPRPRRPRMDGPPDRDAARPPGRVRRRRDPARRDPGPMPSRSSPGSVVTSTSVRSAWTTARCSAGSNGSGREIGNRSGW